MPTVLELAEVSYPAQFNGREVRQLIGKSLLPVLTGKSDTVHAANEGMGWELFERKAYIKGKWKILRLPEPFSSGQWQLFDLENDPGEVDDLSGQYVGIRDSLISDWEQYAKENDVFDHRGHYDSLLSKSLVGHD